MSCAAPRAPRAVADNADGVAPGHGKATPVTFAWGVPCRVPVTEVASKKDTTVKMTYDVVLEPAETGDELRVRLEHFAFQEANGIDLTTAAMRARMAEAVALTAAIPVMRIATNGSFLGVVDLDKAVAWMLDQPPFNKKPEAAEKVRAMMLSPQMLEALTGKMGEIWGTWVGAWLARELAPGETVQLQSGVQFGTNAAAGHSRLSHLGAVADAPGMMRFRLESEEHGAELVRAARGLIASMLAEMAIREPPELFITDGDRQQFAEIDTDPTTLRPGHAVFDTKSHFVFKNGKDMTYTERRDDTFHWDRAQGVCAARPEEHR
jgi:hypothetical protein